MKIHILLSHGQDAGTHIRGAFKKRSAATALWKKRAGDSYSLEREAKVGHSIKTMKVK